MALEGTFRASGNPFVTRIPKRSGDADNFRCTLTMFLDQTLAYESRDCCFWAYGGRCWTRKHRRNDPGEKKHFRNVFSIRIALGGVFCACGSQFVTRIPKRWIILRPWQPIGDLWQPICNENTQEMGSFCACGSQLASRNGIRIRHRNRHRRRPRIRIQIETQKPSNSKLRSNRIETYIDIGIDIEISNQI